MMQQTLWGSLIGIGIGIIAQTAWALEREPGASVPGSFHGYGELHYNNPEGSGVPGKDDPAQFDMHRTVFGWSYAWNDQISLHAEVDFEHSFKEPELEFAYLDYLMRPELNVRAGLMLMPVGPLNEFHEPPLFYSVERSYVNKFVIPTTWQEAGAGIFGSHANLQYRLYLVSGLNSKGFTAKDGIRKGRQHAAEAPSEEIAAVGRIEYIGVPGLTAAASAYRGGANQDKGTKDVGVGILEGDLRYKKSGFDLTAVWVQINIDHPENAVDETGALTKVGKKIMGHSFEVAYHLLPVLLPGTTKDLVPFVRWERFNTQKETPAAYVADPKYDRKVVTAGFAYYPIPEVAMKADWERWEDQGTDPAAEHDGTRVNLGLAYMFN